MEVMALEQGLFYECVGLTERGIRFRLTLARDQGPLPDTWEHYWTVPYEEFRSAELEKRTDQLLIERRCLEQRRFLTTLARHRRLALHGPRRRAS